MSNITLLQAAHDAVQQHMPVLQFCMLPRAVAVSLATLPHADAAAAAVVNHARAAVSECQICGSAAPKQQQDLTLTLSTQLDVRARVCRVTRARFACAVCAALTRPSLLLGLATPRPGAPAGDHEDRSQHLQQLFLHLAGVNGAAAEVTGNPEALAVWTQELACRASSVSVTASSLGRWRLQPAHNSPAQLLRGLLQQDALPAASPSNKGKAPAAAPAAAATGKRSAKAVEPIGGSGSSQKVRRREESSGLGVQHDAAQARNGGSARKKATQGVAPAGFQAPQPQGKKRSSTAGGSKQRKLAR